MKSVNFILTLYFVSIAFLPLNAQEKTHVRVLKDISVESCKRKEMSLYENSTLAIEGIDLFKVRIESVSANAAATTKNQNGGIVEGAIFDGTEYDRKLNNIHFNDSAGQDRFDITDVTISVLRCYITDDDTVLIPEDAVKEIQISPVDQSNVKECFKYNSENRTLSFIPDDEHKIGHDIKVVINDDVRVVRSGEESTWDNVDEEATVRVILSNSNDYFEDILLNLKELPNDSFRSNEGGGASWWNTFTNVPTAVWIFLIIVILLALGYWIFTYVLNKKNSEHGDDSWEKEDDLNQSSLSFGHQKENKKGKGNDEKKEKANQSNHDEAQLVGQLSSFSDVSQYIEENNKTLNDILGSIGEIKYQISSIKQGMKGTKAVENLNRELEDANKKSGERKKLIDDLQGQLNSKNEEITKISNENANLKQELEDAKKTPDGVLAIEGINDFVKQAKYIMEACYDAEVSIQNYIKSLSKEDNEKMAFFMATYIKNMPIEKRNQWNGIISTLSIKGYINDAQVTPYLQQEQDQKGWLRKHFIEDVLQLYISPLLIMLDEIGNASNYGISMPYDTDSLINKIIKECEQFGARVKYVKSYQEVIDPELIDENDPDLPKEIEGLVVIKEGVPLFLSHIGVEAEGTRSDKTICVIRK